MFQQLSPVVLGLIAVNVAVYVLQSVLGDMTVIPFALWPLDSVEVPGAPAFHLHQLVTYAFLHGNLTHLFFNMFALFMFGPDIERVLGASRFAFYYLVCIVGAAATQLLVIDWMGREPFPTVGASGGVFGILLAFGMAFPRRKLMLLFPPIPMPAWLFVTLYGVMELVLGVTGTAQGVAHFAHLGGMAAGLILLLIWRRRRTQ